MKKKHSCYLQISTYRKLIFSSIILENAVMIWHRDVLWTRSYALLHL